MIHIVKYGCFLLYPQMGVWYVSMYAISGNMCLCLRAVTVLTACRPGCVFRVAIICHWMKMLIIMECMSMLKLSMYYHHSVDGKSVGYRSQWRHKTAAADVSRFQVSSGSPTSRQPHTVTSGRPQIENCFHRSTPTPFFSFFSRLFFVASSIESFLFLLSLFSLSFRAPASSLVPPDPDWVSEA